MAKRRIAPRGIALLCATAALACGKEPTSAPVPVTLVPSAMVALPGTVDQSGVVGAAVAERPGVRVTTAAGIPVPGVDVLFAIGDGGGALSGETTTTGADGSARVGSWTLGLKTGPNSVIATAAGVPSVTFDAVGGAGPASVLRVHGSLQVAEAGTALATPLGMTLSDAHGNAVTGAAVAFSIVAGDGTIERAQAVTDARGEASPGAWTLGTVAGANLLRVTAGSLSGAWAARGAPGAAARLVAVAPTTQSAARGTAVPFAPAVRVLDRFNNGVAGVPVAFSATGSATVHGLGRQSDSTGLASLDSVVMHPAAGSAVVTTTAPGLSPAQFALTGVGVLDAARIYTRESGTCALLASGVGFCWGLSSFGELGDGTRTQRTLPTGIAGATRFTDLAFRYGATCGLRDTDGAPFCWGRNDFGELGFEGRSAYTPRAVNTTLRFRQLAASSGTPLCGLTSGGDVHCWGDIAGSGMRLLDGGVKLATITAGSYHKCGLDANRDAWCWGANSFGSDSTGQLGDGTSTTRPTPVRVMGGLRFSTLGLGALHSCGISLAGDAWCWGSNGWNQLGDGTRSNRRQPVRVASPLKFSRVTGGNTHSCALAIDGEAWCWGDNTSGQLGDGTNTPRATPVRVAGGLRFREISSFLAHTCAIATSGRTYCWGFNLYGMLGNGGTADSPTPVAVVP